MTTFIHTLGLGSDSPTTPGGPRVIPWIVLTIVGVITFILGGIADWSPEQWIAVITAIVGGVGALCAAITKATIKILQAFRRVEAKAEASVPPDQLDAFARKVASEMGKQVAAEVAKQLAAKNAEPPPRVQT